MVGTVDKIKIKRLIREASSQEFEPEKALIKLFLRTKRRQDVTLAPGERKALPTGIAIELPLECEGQITISHELAELGSMTLLNSPGTIDPDYRGEIHVITKNASEYSVTLLADSHIADMRIRRFAHATFVEVDQLETSVRENDGMGSTGVD